jgi:hypothetical protein
MPIYELRGYLLPQHRKISFPVEGNFHWQDDTSLISDISVNVTESVIKLKCETNHAASEAEENQIRFRALASVRAMTGSASFIAGLGITPVLTTMLRPDGTEMPVDFKYTSLEQLVTAFDLSAQGFVGLCLMIGNDLNLLFVFNDLVDSIAHPLQAIVNCGRALEGIRLLMSPNVTSKPEQWRIMQEKLNIARSYRELVTEQSQGPRHADRTGVTDVTFQTSLERTWTIMNRYLEFRKRGEIPLTAPEFDLLA